MMSVDDTSVSVSLLPEVIQGLDRLVETDRFESRAEALRYGARLVVREEQQQRLREYAREKVADGVEDKQDHHRTS